MIRIHFWFELSNLLLNIEGYTCHYDINKYPECKKYVEMGFHNAQFNFRLDDTRISEIFQGESPSRNKGELKVVDPPAGYPVPELPEMPNEHSPGLNDLNA